jgi:hypothetical protein
LLIFGLRIADCGLSIVDFLIEDWLIVDCCPRDGGVELQCELKAAIIPNRQSVNRQSPIGNQPIRNRQSTIGNVSACARFW